MTPSRIPLRLPSRSLCNAVVLVGVAITAACGASEHSSNGSSAGGASGNGNVILFDGGPGGAPIVSTGGSAGYALPPGFTATELGGYQLGQGFDSDTPPAGVGAGGETGVGCGSTILGVVRDFRGANIAGGHPDFEAFSGKKLTPKLVADALGSDDKPVYGGICDDASVNRQECPEGQQMTTQANFDQWYRYAADVNHPYVLYISLAPNNGILTFQSDFFFPLDGAGWNDLGNGQYGQQHNFNFTTEVHTQFRYNGGETFTFIGDDDVWVFVNGHLAVDLGGLHPSTTGSVDLGARAAELGISIGNTYPLDLFHAERHTNASHFRIDTNLQFTNCGVIVPEPPIH